MNLSLETVSNPVNGIQGKRTVKREKLGGLRESVQQFKLKVSGWLNKPYLLGISVLFANTHSESGDIKIHYE